MVRYPLLVLSFTQARLCDTPFCNVLRDNCAIPHKNKHEIREGANREELTVKKIINNEMFFCFSPFVSLINREKPLRKP